MQLRFTMLYLNDLWICLVRSNWAINPVDGVLLISFFRPLQCTLPNGVLRTHGHSLLGLSRLKLPRHLRSLHAMHYRHSGLRLAHWISRLLLLWHARLTLGGIIQQTCQGRVLLLGWRRVSRMWKSIANCHIRNCSETKKSHGHVYTFNTFETKTWIEDFWLFEDLATNLKGKFHALELSMRIWLQKIVREFDTNSMYYKSSLCPSKYDSRSELGDKF